MCAAWGQSVTRHEALQQQVRSGTITPLEALYSEALHMAGESDAALKDAEYLPERCGFGLRHRVRQAWHDFSPAQRKVLAPAFARPSLPEHHISSEGRFRIHYTLTGWDAVSAEDLTGSGVPDWVEETAAAMERSYAVQVTQLGLQPPPPDPVDGPEWDVYILDIDAWGYYGWTDHDVRVTRNPDTYTSYITLDNDYALTLTKGLDGMRVTAAHEFNHMIQLGYHGRYDVQDGFWDDLFMMEASSTWMEDVVYDDINDYYYYLDSFFMNSNKAFNHVGNLREYGLCIWFHFLEKHLGGRGFFVNLWENIVDFPALPAMEHTLRRAGTSLDREIPRFYAWNVMTGSRADTVRYYPEGKHYPETALDSALVLADPTEIDSAIRSTAARYYRLETGDGTEIFAVPVNVNWNFDAISERFVLKLSSASDFLNTRLTNQWYAALETDDFMRWRSTLVLRAPGEETDFIELAGVRSGLTQDDLVSCYPNPHVWSEHELYPVTIPFILKNPGRVRLVVTSVSGFVVEDREEFFNRGLHQFEWNVNRTGGSGAASGIYVIRLFREGKLLRQEKAAVIR